MQRLPRPAAALAGAALLLCAAGGARASVLYKCDTNDGSIAYTSTSKGYTNCKAISVFADPPKPKAVAPVRAATPKRGWVYEENAAESAKADFSDISAAVVSEPASIVRADFHDPVVLRYGGVGRDRDVRGDRVAVPDAVARPGQGQVDPLPRPRLQDCARPVRVVVHPARRGRCGRDC